MNKPRSIDAVAQLPRDPLMPRSSKEYRQTFAWIAYG